MSRDRLGLAAPRDLTAKMDLTGPAGDIVYDKDGEPGWFEFYGPQSEAARAFQEDQVVQSKMEQAREARRGRARSVSAVEARREFEREKQTALDFIRSRLKAWRLVNADGEVEDLAITSESVAEIFGDPDYQYLMSDALEFLNDPQNFFPKRSTSSSSSQSGKSEESSEEGQETPPIAHISQPRQRSA